MAGPGEGPKDRCAPDQSLPERGEARSTVPGTNGHPRLFAEPATRLRSAPLSSEEVKKRGSDSEEESTRGTTRRREDETCDPLHLDNSSPLHLINSFILRHPDPPVEERPFLSHRRGIAVHRSKMNHFFLPLRPCQGVCSLASVVSDHHVRGLGELAQLARALAWHARGHRFDSGILHEGGPLRAAFSMW